MKSLQQRHPRAVELAQEEELCNLRNCIVQQQGNGEEFECIPETDNATTEEVQEMVGESTQEKSTASPSINHTHQHSMSQLFTSISVARPLEGEEVEILQMWCIMALHAVYNLVHAERVLSLVIPLYYYFKMILLFILFVPGTKIPNFLFGTVVVPAIDWTHKLSAKTKICDYETAKDQVVLFLQLLPLHIVDVLLLPGTFSMDLQVRLSQTETPTSLCLGNHTESRVSEDTPILSCVYDASISMMHTDEQHISSTPPQFSTPDASIIWTNLDATPNAPISRKEPMAPVKAKCATRSRSTFLLSTSPSIQGGNKEVSVGSPRRHQEEHLGSPTPRSPLEDSFLSTASPVAQSRVYASGILLRNFSREHGDLSYIQTSNKGSRTESTSPSSATLSSTISPLKPVQLSWGESSETLDIDVNPTFSDDQESIESQAQESEDESCGSSSYSSSDEDFNSFDHLGRTGRISSTGSTDSEIYICDNFNGSEDDLSHALSSTRSRVSDVMRTLITGDTNIRVRDFLFDLNLPCTSPSAATVDAERDSSLPSQGSLGPVPPSDHKRSHDSRTQPYLGNNSEKSEEDKRRISQSTSPKTMTRSKNLKTLFHESRDGSSSASESSNSINGRVQVEKDCAHVTKRRSARLRHKATNAAKRWR